MASLDDTRTIHVPPGMTVVIGVVGGVAGDRFKIGYARAGKCSELESIIDFALDGQTHYVGLCGINYKNTTNPIVLDVPGLYTFTPEAGNSAGAELVEFTRYVTPGGKV
jgi:hypothetical protein